MKGILNDMVQNQELDITDSVMEFCVSWVSCRVCVVGTKRFVMAWNNHRIDGRFPRI